MKCAIITIGTELLIGQVTDTNSAYLGHVLNDIGVQVVSRFTIDDNREDILKALSRSLEDADLIITTGGLGPTKDDITKKVLADFLGVELYFDESQYEKIQQFFKKINRPTTEAHKNQCFFPVATEFIENRMGTAQGMLMCYQGKRIISMPGVPYEMKHIMETGVLPMLEKEQKEFILHRTIRTAGVGETLIESKIESIQQHFPAYLNLAYLPSLGSVRVRISGKSANRDNLERELNQVRDEIVEVLGDMVFAQDQVELEEVIGTILLQKGLMLGVAESCTGGALGAKIVSIPGSSSYFEGGLITYSNQLKSELLGVKSETLLTHGAVSEEVVIEMMYGALKRLNVDIAISVSGIAGPTGGSAEKPVGTVWVCVGTKNSYLTHKLQLGKDRIKNIEYTSFFALNFLRLFVLNHSNTAHSI